MNSSTRTISFRRRIGLFAMVLSMLFVQSMQIHVHTYSHDAGMSGHVHHDTAHSVFNLTQDAHADEVAQHDLSYSGLLNKLSFIPVLAIFFLGLSLFVSHRQCMHLARHFFRPVFSRSYLSCSQPPLRAPPLV